ncbi:alpha/beta hydrolase [Nitratireductor mangrovi]|uniref:Alpha/beta hydrolase n=1 Tax=Nitratireductor mangrovi TaxID=2599600 RepID=A0A5B8L5V5_9HYPH|nr:alpha/beta hydrolase [Nitratireductor mangrovi]
MRLADDRRLAWSEWGPREGLPVLFCTGAGMSGSLGFGAECLEREHVRLIGIDRPGLGASGVDAAKSFESWTRDVGELIGARNLTRPCAVGFSQGGPFALALAAGGLVSAVAIVAGQDDLGCADLQDRLDPIVAAMIAAARADPTAFEQQIAATASAEWLWQMVVSMSAPQDRQVYEDGAFGRLYRTCLAEGFSQGAGGYARDLVNAVNEWPFALEEIAVPVRLWYGRLDASPVHSPDFGVTLARRLPNAKLTVDDDAGGSILWTRSGDILRDLIETVAAPAAPGAADGNAGRRSHVSNAG